MNIIVHAVYLYIHLIFIVAPYLASGVAVWLYYQYKEVKLHNAAADAYAQMIGVSREDAKKIIFRDPI